MAVCNREKLEKQVGMDRYLKDGHIIEEHELIRINTFRGSKCHCVQTLALRSC